MRDFGSPYPAEKKEEKYLMPVIDKDFVVLLDICPKTEWKINRLSFPFYLLMGLTFEHRRRGGYEVPLQITFQEKYKKNGNIEEYYF